MISFVGNGHFVGARPLVARLHANFTQIGALRGIFVVTSGQADLGCGEPG